MRYIIPPQRIKKVFFLFLNTLPKLKDLVKYEVNPGLYDFHHWSYGDEDYWEIDPPLRYYTPEYFTTKNIPNIYPQLVISREVKKDVVDAFGHDNIFMEYTKEWFSIKFNLPVKTITY